MNTEDKKREFRREYHWEKGLWLLIATNLKSARHSGASWQTGGRTRLQLQLEQTKECVDTHIMNFCFRTIAEITQETWEDSQTP